jgi:Zn-dependent M28 family amino/carboxypeptidase
MRIWLGLFLCLLAFSIGGCAAASATLPIFTPMPALTPTSTPLPRTFDGQHAYQEYLLAQMKLGVRPAGSDALRKTGDYIIAQVKQSNWQVVTQEFAYRNVPVRNIIAKINEGRGPLVIIGAHYDTRPRADQDKQNPDKPVPGANDGASGVAVLLELARTLDTAKLKNEVWLVFFDAEDNGDLAACDLLPTPNCDKTLWTWSIGATYVADHLPTKPQAVIVIDMIGDADQNIYYEQNSDKELQEQIWSIATQLGYTRQFVPEFKWSMSDDHTPFLERGIRAVDLIDFDYPYWHTTQDTADKCSPASLERVGRVLKTWLEK